MERKHKASIIILTSLTFITLIVLLNVLMGRIGDLESWRIIFALVGFVGISTLSMFLIRINLRKIRENRS